MFCPSVKTIASPLTYKVLYYRSCELIFEPSLLPPILDGFLLSSRSLNLISSMPMDACVHTNVITLKVEPSKTNNNE